MATKEKGEGMTKRKKDRNGFIEIEKNPLSRSGIFEYYGSEIDAPESDKIYKVLRSDEELKKAVDFFKGKPLVNDHTTIGDLGVDPNDKGIHGVVGDNVFFDDGVIYGNLRLYTKEIKELIDSGKKELSCGYWSKYSFKSGKYKDQDYDAVQEIHDGNHIALVDAGRMGAAIAVLDNEKTKGNKMEKELLAVADEVAKLNERLSLLETKDEEATKDEDEETKDEEATKDEETKAAMDTGEIVEQVKKDIAEAQAMYSIVQPLIGTFDCALKTDKDIAEYAAKKLNLSGDPVTAVKTYAYAIGLKSTSDAQPQQKETFLKAGVYK